MSFHSTAQEIRVDDGHILRAKVPNGAGELVDAELDLDSVLGNSDGNFQWGSGGFSGSAQNITFTLEGADNVPILRADLNNASGSTSGRDVNLAERIRAENGALVFA